MKNSILAGLAFVIGLTACSKQDNSSAPLQHDELTKKIEPMKNLISIVEIPVVDFPRAVTFYETVLDVSIREMEMGGVRMGILPGEARAVAVVLAKGEDYKPTLEGAVLYLNAGDDLQPVLDRVKQNGGQIIVPKTAISPEMGFFALFIDTEGNKMGLHSAK